MSLRVYNATDTAGLATTVANALKERGFTVGEIANDTSGREVTGVGELRHGPRGTDAADFVRLFLPGAGDYPDTRADATVDVVIGPEFNDAGHARRRSPAALAPAKDAASRLLTDRLPAAAVLGQGSCSSASRSTNGAAIDGAAAIAIGSANGLPGSPVTTSPASAATRAPAAWSQGLRSSS